MIFLIAVIVIALISVGLAFWSLRGLERKPEVDEVKKKLEKGRVVFHSQTSSSE